MGEVRRTDEIQGKIIHEYDGIEEADNALPRWWLAIFYLSTAFAVAYWFYYHEFGIGLGSYDAYEAALQARAGGAPAAATPEELEALSQDPEAVAQGQTTFQTSCVACHGTQGEGKIGPNLTDDFWIHKGGAGDIYKTIGEGVVAKGMPAWRLSLGADKVAKVTAFVLTLRNTHVAGKEPQGERWVPAAAGSASAAASVSGAPATSRAPSAAASAAPSAAPSPSAAATAAPSATP
jgi:cytochrome c oxidase cbb3-type subunit 3